MPSSISIGASHSICMPSRISDRVIAASPDVQESSRRQSCGGSKGYARIGRLKYSVLRKNDRAKPRFADCCLTGERERVCSAEHARREKKGPWEGGVWGPVFLGVSASECPQPSMPGAKQ